VMDEQDRSPIRVAYQRRNRDLDPQLVWRGKDQQDESDLVVNAPPLYIQEKVHPKALIDELQRESREREFDAGQITPDLFSDFNGLPKGADRTDFYQYDGNWQNRPILGDSLQVMASLAEREGLRGKVQCIYLDPPYGIKFNSNFQWSTTSRDVKDGKAEHITREPEQVKAFRDTWRDGIHSYLTYLRDRLTVARNLLTESGSIFVQIGDENVHRVRAMMDEVFGEANFCNQIAFSGTSGFSASLLSRTMDYVLWYTKDIERAKYRALFAAKVLGGEGASLYKRVLTKDGEEVPLGRWMKGKDLSFPIEVEAHPDIRFFGAGDITSQGKASTDQTYVFCGSVYGPGANNHWKPNHPEGLERLAKANRIYATQKNLNYIRFLDDFEYMDRPNVWLDTAGQGQYGETGKIYVVQTANSVIERCIMMTTDPGDLVLDPTCGSGTTATVAEQWGRRWITIDTSRVALALARARIMGARYPYYLLADSPEGQRKEAEITRSVPSTAPTHGDIRHGFVYERVPHITLKSIANNTDIDVIWDKFQQEL
ncbi:MAG: site-specific DNA-methyltransferase, partial [Nitrosospira sp.]|nr:site-specific DNA-methyltransferase [Nitrosospira sp.]